MVTLQVLSSAGDSDFFFNPTTPINFANGAFVMVTGGDSSMQTNLNGGGWVDTETDGTLGNWNRIATGAGTITTLGFRRTNVNEPNLAAIAINGTAAGNILVDNTGVDYDLTADSQTQTFGAESRFFPSWNQVFEDRSLATANAKRRIPATGIGFHC